MFRVGRKCGWLVTRPAPKPAPRNLAERRGRNRVDKSAVEHVCFLFGGHVVDVNHRRLDPAVAHPLLNPRQRDPVHSEAGPERVAEIVKGRQRPFGPDFAFPEVVVFELAHIGPQNAPLEALEDHGGVNGFASCRVGEDKIVVPVPVGDIAPLQEHFRNVACQRHHAVLTALGFVDGDVATLEVNAPPTQSFAGLGLAQSPFGAERIQTALYDAQIVLRNLGDDLFEFGALQDPNLAVLPFFGRLTAAQG